MTTERARELADESVEILSGIAYAFNERMTGDASRPIGITGEEITQLGRAIEAFGDALVRLKAAGHAPGCGVNRCVECGKPIKYHWMPVHEHDKPSHGVCATFQLGECTKVCWQHEDWRP